MTYARAEAILRDFFAPGTIDQFFHALGRESLEVLGGSGNSRRKLFGDDPKRTLLAGYGTHATQLKCYGVAPAQPPPPTRPVANPEEFLELIRSFHERDYTVRIPDVIPLSPRLQEVARALETLLHQPVQAAMFWSKAEAKAIVHYDSRDNLAVQLEGKKRWFISTEPAGLQNHWKQVGEPVPQLGPHRVVDVEPGDLIYIPRGTPHTVESTSESLHLAILFVPTTVRDAIAAVVDYLADFDLDLRQPAFAGAAGADLATLRQRIVAGLTSLIEHCSTDDFIKAAMNLRSARFVADLPPLARSGVSSPVTGDTVVRHSPLAISHLRTAQGSLDFTVPAEHIAIHPGVERELRFIGTTETFRVGDIPGESSEDVRIALVSRLIASGLLEVAT